MKTCKGYYCHAIIYSVPDKNKKSIKRTVPFTKATELGLLTGQSCNYPTKESQESYCPSCKKQLENKINRKLNKNILTPFGQSVRDLINAKNK